MEFSELVFARRTIRRFTPEPLRQATLEKILRAGLAAPSPNNSVPWSISVITNGEVIQKMREVVHHKLDGMFANISADHKSTLEKIKVFSSVFANAPVVLAIFTKDYHAPIHDLMAEANLNADQVSDLRRHPELQATGALVQNMLLAATEEGLGTCWISGALVARKELEKILKAGDLHLETLVALGHHDSQPHPKEPLDLELYVNYVP
ncbi:MAG: nitroreductase family protein [Candidatus Rifleibacteriota bacterium]